jgi:N-acetylglutamate synthase-like GNAT family acetyltransferase
MSAIKVLLAKKENSLDVSNIFKVLNTEKYFFSDRRSINKYIRRKECFVASQNKNIIGAMVLRFSDQSSEISLISSVKKGAGRILVNFAIQKCIKENIPKIWCWSLKRYGAEGFYKKMGFKERFLLKKQWHGEDCYFFGREISSKK